MHNPDDLCRHLQTLWHEHFPLAHAMQLQVDEYASGRLVTRAPLQLNSNIHNTAFAGSLYAAQAMTAWGLLYLELYVAGMDASIIHADGQIQFAKTITQDIVTCIDMPHITDNVTEVRNVGKTRLSMTTQVKVGDEVCSEFTGTYLARLNKS